MPVAGDAGLAFWYRASDLSGLADGAAVSTWTAYAGSSVATQATGVNQPTKQTVDGRTCVRFDGSDDRLSLDGAALTFSQNVGGVSVFMKMKINRWPVHGGPNAYMFSATTPSATNRVMMRLSFGWLFETGGRRADADVSAQAVGTGSPEAAQVKVFTGILDYTNSDAFAFLNGVAAGSTTTFQTSGLSSNTASSGASLGDFATPGQPVAMDLYELIVYNVAVNASVRTEVEQFLLTTAVPGFRRSSAGMWAEV